MKGWFTCLQECVLRLDIRGAKGVSLLDRFLWFFGGPGGEGVGEDASMTMQFFPREEDTGIMTIIFFLSSLHHLNFLFPI